MTEDNKEQAYLADEITLRTLSVIRMELRNSLSTIRGSSNLLLEEEIAPLTDDQKYLVNMICRSQERASRIVTEIYELSILQAGVETAKFENIDLATCVTYVVESLRDNIDRKDQQLLIQLPKLPPVKAPQRELENVLKSILENAHKYTSPAGQIKLSAEIVDKFVKVIIVDTGCGIRKEEQKNIFKLWYRSGTPIVREQDGLGISLCLAKHYVKHFGGEIAFESEQNKGSTFWFTVPISSHAAG
jgi:signal transduction histidine kinase